MGERPKSLEPVQWRPAPTTRFSTFMRLAGGLAVSLVQWLPGPRFTFSGRDYRYFFHYCNCGWPPGRCTERIVELALADSWLHQLDPAGVAEVGAVTPYYWPRRLRHVIDPSDPHELVTRRQSLFEADLGDLSVLSISTLEHVGTGEYGMKNEPALVIQALAKIVEEAPRFLITVPVGYNPVLDEVLFADAKLGGGGVRFLVRAGDGFRWRQEHEPSRARLPYGKPWANSIAILERGGLV